MGQIIIKRTQSKNIEDSPAIQKILTTRAEKILEVAQRLAPRDTGNLVRSLSIVRTTARGKNVVRLVSSDPQIRPILEGTSPPYAAPPPFGESSPLGGWARRRGYVTFPSRRGLAISIRTKGTLPAGSRTGRADWLTEAIRAGIQ